LEATFRAYVDLNPYVLGSKENPETATKMATIRYTMELPSDIALILGDAVHNLRVALDHTVWELIGLDRDTQDHYTQFLTGKDRVSYEASCNGIKTPRDDAKKFLISLAAYKDGGGNDLYAIARLDNIDKHTIIIPAMTACTPPNVQLIRPGGSVWWEMGSPTFISPLGGAVGWGGVDPANTVQFDQNRKPTFAIGFGKIEVFPEDPIIPTLLHLADAVGETIGKFAEFVGTRAW
jgi:hypothetical protein